MLILKLLNAQKHERLVCGLQELIVQDPPLLLMLCCQAPAASSQHQHSWNTIQEAESHRFLCR